MKTIFYLITFIILPLQTLADRPASAPQLENIFYNLPILETERLILRAVQADDVVDLHQVYADPEVVKYIASELDQTMADTKKWVEWRLEKYKMGKPTPWAVVLKETNHVIGLCGFRDWHPEYGAADLMYLEARKYWHNGYMNEALNVIFAFAFRTWGLNRIDSMVHPDNVVSTKMHEKFGFEKIGTMREGVYYRGSYCDRVIFSLLKSNYLND